MTFYNLFISHSWSYSKSYEGLVSLLNQADNFSYKNYSVPKYDPIHGARTDAELREAIRKQMAPASVVIILAGVYATHSEWINKEIRLAKSGFSTPKKLLLSSIGVQKEHRKWLKMQLTEWSNGTQHQLLKP